MTLPRSLSILFAGLCVTTSAFAQPLPRVGETIQMLVQVDLSGHLDNSTESGPSQLLRGQGNINGNVVSGPIPLRIQGAGAIQWRRGSATQRLAARRMLQGNVQSFVRLSVVERTPEGLRVAGDVFFCLPDSETGSGPLTPPSSCYSSETGGGNPEVMMGETRARRLPGFMGETGGGNPEVFKLELEGTLRGGN